MSSKFRLVLVSVAVLLALALVVHLLQRQDPPPGRTHTPTRAPSEQADAGSTAVLQGRAPPEVVLPNEPAAEPTAAPGVEPVDDPDAEWRLEVEVRGPDGAPPDATRLVFVSPSSERIAEGTTGKEGTATVGVRGTGRLFVLPSGGWAPWTSDLLSPPPSGVHALTVELDTGLEIGGEILDPQGMPVRARVRAEPTEGWPWIERLPLWTWRARSGRDGAFRIRGLLPGAYELQVTLRPGRGGRAQPGLVPVAPVVDAGAENVVIRLLPVSGIVIRLVDVDSGEAVRAMADVYFVEGAEETHRNWFTGGSLVLDEVPGTRMRLRFRVEGYEPSEVEELEFREAGVGEERVLRLRRDPDGVVAVTFLVQDDEGRDVEAVSATRWIEHGDPENPVRFGLGHTHDIPTGELTLPLPPGRHVFDFKVDPKDDEDLALLLPARVEFEVSQGEPLRRKVVFERGGGIRIHHPQDWLGGLLVRRPDGSKAPRFGIRMLEAGGRVFFPIPRGEWVLTFLLGDGGEHEVRVQIEAGGYADVSFDPAAVPPR